MDYLKYNALSILIVIYLVLTSVLGGHSFGAAAANVTTITNPWVFQKSVTQTSTNAATSTFSGGCFQTTATSTATPIRFNLTSAVSATTTFNGTSQGFVTWQYGSCPI